MKIIEEKIPHPFEDKDMELRKESREIPFRKENFEIVYHYYSSGDEEYTTPDIEDVNMKQVYNQYRDKHDIPFPEEIREIRESYGLPAKRMAELLGFGVNTYGNYEKGEIPSVSNGTLIQEVARDPNRFLSLVERHSIYSDDKKKKDSLIKRINKLIEKRNDDIYTQYQGYLMGNNWGFSLPNNETGYKQPDFNKFTQMVVFFSERLLPYKTQLNKLLFYTDFVHYKNKVSSISGFRYSAIPLGPVPDNYEGIYNLIENKGEIDIDYQENDWGPTKRFKNTVPFNESLFTSEELDTMNFVCEKFGKMSTKEIVDYSHEETAWVENKERKGIIDYKYAFDIKI